MGVRNVRWMVVAEEPGGEDLSPAPWGIAMAAMVSYLVRRASARPFSRRSDEGKEMEGEPGVCGCSAGSRVRWRVAITGWLDV